MSNSVADNDSQPNAHRRVTFEDEVASFVFKSDEDEEEECSPNRKRKAPEQKGRNSVSPPDSLSPTANEKPPLIRDIIYRGSTLTSSTPSECDPPQSSSSSSGYPYGILYSCSTLSTDETDVIILQQVESTSSTDELGVPLQVSAGKQKEESITEIVYNGLLSGDHEVICGTVKRLADLSFAGHPKSDSNCREIFNAGAHTVVIKYLQRCVGNQDQEGFVGDALGLLMDLSGDCCEDHAKTIAKIPNAIASTISAMKNFPESTFVRRNACGFLGNLAALNDDVRLGVAWAIPLIVETMEQFPNDAFAQHCGSLVLNNLLDMRDRSGVMGIVSAIRAARGFSVLVAAMENHPEDKNIDKWASFCIEKLIKKK